MTNVLTNVAISQRGTATATDEKYNYSVDYEIKDNGATLGPINVNVIDKTTNSYAGNMSLRDSNKNISATDKADANAMLTMFDAIILEVSNELHGTIEANV